MANQWKFMKQPWNLIANDPKDAFGKDLKLLEAVSVESVTCRSWNARL